MPATGDTLEVEFTHRRCRRRSEPGQVLRLTAWCWVAVADGRFDRVAVRSGDRCAHAKIHRAVIRRERP
jgi:hypothetical protein